jgi:hypothetical protein
MVEFKGRFHPGSTTAGRQVSPPAMRNQNFGECGGTTGKWSSKDLGVKPGNWPADLPRAAPDSSPHRRWESNDYF